MDKSQNSNQLQEALKGLGLLTSNAAEAKGAEFRTTLAKKLTESLDAPREDIGDMASALPKDERGLDEAITGLENKYGGTNGEDEGGSDPMDGEYDSDIDDMEVDGEFEDGEFEDGEDGLGDEGEGFEGDEGPEGEGLEDAEGDEDDEVSDEELEEAFGHGDEEPAMEDEDGAFDPTSDPIVGEGFDEGGEDLSYSSEDELGDDLGFDMGEVDDDLDEIAETVLSAEPPRPMGEGNSHLSTYPNARRVASKAGKARNAVKAGNAGVNEAAKKKIKALQESVESLKKQNAQLKAQVAKFDERMSVARERFNEATAIAEGLTRGWGLLIENVTTREQKKELFKQFTHCGSREEVGKVYESYKRMLSEGTFPKNEREADVEVEQPKPINEAVSKDSGMNEALNAQFRRHLKDLV